MRRYHKGYKIDFKLRERNPAETDPRKKCLDMSFVIIAPSGKRFGYRYDDPEGFPNWYRCLRVGLREARFIIDGLPYVTKEVVRDDTVAEQHIAREDGAMRNPHADADAVLGMA